MLISTKHLRAAGCHITVSQNGRELKDEFYIEINFTAGKPLSPGLHDEVEDAVGPELGGAVVEALAHKIHGLQVLEAINKTSPRAWRERHSKD